MKALLAAAGLMLGGVAVVGWPAAGERYPVSLDDARDRLAGLTFGESVLHDSAGAPRQWTDAAGAHLRWAFRFVPGQVPSWCEAVLVPDGEAATRASLACGAADRRDPLVARNADQLLRVIVHEHVDAALSGRPFDHGRLGTALFGYALIHRAELARHRQQAQGG